MLRGVRARRTVLRAAVYGILVVALSGCSDLLAVAGLSDLSGFWVGRYDSELDFYLDLDDDVYGLYGRAGFLRGRSSSDLFVDGERDGSRVVFYSDEAGSSGLIVFEGHVTGRDRIEGLVYLEPIPRRVVLRRE
ncbi:MAG TPA: hypothetical protein VF746_29115 [Longimicrobium sp.]|jgi:hypothetical protein